jgi:hypothetical protein
MEELQPPDLAIWRLEKVIFFHNHKIQIQDHGVIALVHTSSTSEEQQKWSSYEENDVHFTTDITRFNDQRYRCALVISLPISGGVDRENLQLSGVSSWFRPPLIPRVPPSHKVGIRATKGPPRPI